MLPVYARTRFPSTVARTLFLAGPTPRSADVPSWRPRALELLKEFDGHVFVPEDEAGGVRGDYDDQIEWELTGLARADCILFWVPRQMDTMPALTTNVEFGHFCSSGRVVLGVPPEAAKIRYLRELAARKSVPTFETLEATVAAAVERIGEPVLRQGGECSVPSLVFRSAAFQSWYAAQRQAGNELRNASVEWVLRTGPQKDWLFLWVLAVDLHVKAEGRNKRNEVVIGRPDTAQVVLLLRHNNPLETRAVLIREFRSAAATADGFVHETPGGSSFSGETDPVAVAIDEVSEEVGLRFQPSRLRPMGARQLAPTILSHRAHAFVVELTPDEFESLPLDQVLGAGDGEQTRIEVRTVRELLDDPSVDWATLGMILRSIL
jgi:8-oxo-dGTP pyrophosphatase MutT (NUDIX family)